MIFVSVGMMNYPFTRLLSKMNEIAPLLGEEVVMQVGASNDTFENTTYKKFFDADKMTELYDQCSVLVCHAGVGTILNGVERNIPVVMVPRKADFNEVDNDHQIMIADQIVATGRGIKVMDVDNLYDSILAARRLKFSEYEENKSLVNFLIVLLADLEKRKK